jgi:uncharacterized protein (DUF433 family)
MDAKQILEQLVAPALPLCVDEQGVIRVGHTRIPLETVLVAFQQGYTPEEIAMNFPVLSLEDVYAIVAYYLHNRGVLDSYLESLEREAEARQRFYEARFPTHTLKQQLLERWKQMRQVRK